MSSNSGLLIQDVPLQCMPAGPSPPTVELTSYPTYPVVFYRLPCVLQYCEVCLNIVRLYLFWDHHISVSLCSCSCCFTLPLDFLRQALAFTAEFQLAVAVHHVYDELLLLLLLQLIMFMMNFCFCCCCNFHH